MIILAIESSCDETGVGIARLDDDGTVTLLADEVASSVDEHARFGGVVPEIASRANLEALGPTMRRALDTAGVARPDVVLPGFRSRMYSQAMWTQNLLMPWLWRHFRGISSGDARGAKRPQLAGVDDLAPLCVRSEAEKA